MTTINNNYTFHMDMTPNPYTKSADRYIDFSMVVRNAENKIVASKYNTLSEGVFVMDDHPEAKDEDFKRYGKAIKDAFERFKEYDLVEQMGYIKKAEEINAQNNVNPELRVFDTFWEIFNTRGKLDEMREFLIRVCKEFSLDPVVVRKEISRAKGVLEAGLNKLA